MAKNQHNAGLHYRPLNQLGLSNFNDYIENPIDSRFKFNPPPLKCGKLFGLCKADRQKEKLQKHCPWHPLLKMKAFTLEINGEAEYIGSYLRKMALDGYCLNLDLPQLRRMAYLLQNCSNNLNQVAKRANESGQLYAADLEDLRSRLDELIAIGKQLLAKLSEL